MPPMSRATMERNKQDFLQKARLTVKRTSEKTQRDSSPRFKPKILFKPIRGYYERKDTE